MADFEITSPDGKKFVVTAPQGATQEQVLAYAQTEFAKAPKAAPSAISRALSLHPGVGAAGLGEAALSLGTGAFGSVAGGLAGLGQGATNALGLTSTPAGDRVRQVAGALTYEPRTRAGQGITGAVAYPFEKLAQGADAAGAAVTDATGSPTAAAAVNTLINAAPMALGPLARAIPGESAAAVAARGRTQALNAPQDAGIAAAREAGLKIVPEEAGAGPFARGVATLSGEPKLAKLASKKNAPVINDLIRKDIGLADDVPLSRDALAAIRKEEGAHYEAIKNTGRFDTDARFQADLHAITKGYDTAAKDFAHRQKNPVKETIDGLNVKNMDAASAVEEVKNLRADADKAFRTGDKQLGGAYKDAARALDDMLDRHLKRVGDPAMADAVAKYQAARVRIAKTYAADRALNDTTGNIDAAVYGKELKKGRPLSGAGLQVAEFSQQFPRSTQRAGSATGPTIFDAFVGVGAEALASQARPSLAGFLAGLGARPGARSALLSGPAQSAMTSPRSYGPSRARNLQELLEQINPEAVAVGTAAGQR